MLHKQYTFLWTPYYYYFEHSCVCLDVVRKIAGHIAHTTRCLLARGQQTEQQCSLNNNNDGNNNNNTESPGSARSIVVLLGYIVFFPSPE